VASRREGQTSRRRAPPPVDAIFPADAKADVVILGHLNDHPGDPSIN
jgi:hypothetical protein